MHYNTRYGKMNVSIVDYVLNLDQSTVELTVTCSTQINQTIAFRGGQWIDSGPTASSHFYKVFSL